MSGWKETYIFTNKTEKLSFYFGNHTPVPYTRTTCMKLDKEIILQNGSGPGPDDDMLLRKMSVPVNFPWGLFLLLLHLYWLSFTVSPVTVVYIKNKLYQLGLRCSTYRSYTVYTRLNTFLCKRRGKTRKWQSVIHWLSFEKGSGLTTSMLAGEGVLLLESIAALLQ